MGPATTDTSGGVLPGALRTLERPVVELPVRHHELEQGHGVKDHAGQVRTAGLVVVVLAGPERVGVPLHGGVRQVPVVAALPVPVLVLLGTLAVKLGYLGERADRDEVEAG